MYRIQALIPKIINYDGDLSIDILPDLPENPRNYFIRIDAYPEAKPSHFERHFGYWDIPLEMLADHKKHLTISGTTLSVCVDNEKLLSFPFSWKGDIEEDGAAIWHVSLWNTATIDDIPQVVDISTINLIWNMTKKYEMVTKIPISEEVILIKKIHFPSVVAIDIVEGCNLRCKFCFHEPCDKPKFMNRDVMHKALFFASLSSDAVNLSCLWEPTISELFTEYMKSIPPEVGRIGTLTTNAFRVMSERTASAIANSNIANFNISIQSMNPETCDSLCGGKNVLSNVLANMDLIATHFRRAKTPPSFCTTSMLLRQNYDELIPMARVLKDKYSVNFMEFRTPNDNNQYWMDVNEEWFPQQLLSMSEINDFKNALNENNIEARVNIGLIKESLETPWESNQLSDPDFSAMANRVVFISADGKGNFCWDGTTFDLKQLNNEDMVAMISEYSRRKLAINSRISIDADFYSITLSRNSDSFNIAFTSMRCFDDSVLEIVGWFHLPEVNIVNGDKFLIIHNEINNQDYIFTLIEEKRHSIWQENNFDRSRYFSFRACIESGEFLNCYFRSGVLVKIDGKFQSYFSDSLFALEK